MAYIAKAPDFEKSLIWLNFTPSLFKKGFTSSYTCYTILGMKSGEPRPISAIRVKPDILHQARVAAVIRKKTLGQWLEEAIVEKVERERKLNKEART